MHKSKLVVYICSLVLCILQFRTSATFEDEPLYMSPLLTCDVKVLWEWINHLINLQHFIFSSHLRHLRLGWFKVSFITNLSVWFNLWPPLPLTWTSKIPPLLQLNEDQAFSPLVSSPLCFFLCSFCSSLFWLLSFSIPIYVMNLSLSLSFCKSLFFSPLFYLNLSVSLLFFFSRIYLFFSVLFWVFVQSSLFSSVVLGFHFSICSQWPRVVLFSFVV